MKPILAALAVLAFTPRGRADARTAQKLDDMEDYHDTRQKMDAVVAPMMLTMLAAGCVRRKPGGGL